MELTLRRYNGPGVIAGIPFDSMLVVECAEGEGETVTRRWWEVKGTVAHAAAFEGALMEAARSGRCLVEVPEVGEAEAEVGGQVCSGTVMALPFSM